VPALREVLDGRVELTPIHDLEGLIAAAEAARRPAPPPLSFTWEDAAAATWDVYEQALGASSPRPRARRDTNSRLPATFV
jgi:hypothetical protein